MEKYNGRHKVWGAMYNQGIQDPEKWIKDEYESGLSCNAIAEKMRDELGIKTSPKNINNYTDKMGITRTASQAKKLAMESGRMIYKKKTPKELYFSKGMGVKKRMEIFKRDEFKCTICGAGKDSRYHLEIHHKDGPENDEENLQTVCWLCHRGIHSTEK